VNEFLIIPSTNLKLESIKKKITLFGTTVLNPVFILFTIPGSNTLAIVDQALFLITFFFGF